MAAYTIKPLATAIARSTGGRNGHSQTTDGSVSVDLSVPKELGGAWTTPYHDAGTSFCHRLCGLLRLIAGPGWPCTQEGHLQRGSDLQHLGWSSRRRRLWNRRSDEGRGAIATHCGSAGARAGSTREDLSLQPRDPRQHRLFP